MRKRKENEMPRYIDADALIKKIYPIGIGDGKYVLNAGAVKLAIDNAPTADVAPMSEVERWRGQLEAVIEEIPETKRELVQEIFEEFEKKSCTISCRFPNGETRVECYQLSAEKLAELKKKYAEETNHG
jgi:hypothetical protein